MSGPYTELAPGFYGREIGSRDLGYEGALQELRPGEQLYAVHDQLTRKAAVLLPDEAAFLRTDGQYGAGLSVGYVLAAAPGPDLVIAAGDAPGAGISIRGGKAFYPDGTEAWPDASGCSCTVRDAALDAGGLSITFAPDPGCPVHAGIL